MEKFKDTESLLKSWGFPEYVQKFTEHGVDLELLQILTVAQITILIPEWGPRMEFLAKLESFLSTKNSTIQPSKPVKKRMGPLTSVPKDNEGTPGGYFQKKPKLIQKRPKITSPLSSDSDSDDASTKSQAADFI